jgi:hypothetical protein
VTYAALLPASIGAAAAALHGWTNSGADGLACACGARWGVGGLNAVLIRAYGPRSCAVSLPPLARGAAGCGWRVRSSPAELVDEMRRFTHPLVAASLEPLAREVLRRSLSGPVRPLWSSPATGTQIDSLVAALQAYGENRAADGAVLAPLEPLAAALSLFGWYPYDPGFAADADHVTPGKGTPTDIVACRLCQRRVGMWAFHPKEGLGQGVQPPDGAHLVVPAAGTTGGTSACACSLWAWWSGKVPPTLSSCCASLSGR